LLISCKFCFNRQIFTLDCLCARLQRGLFRAAEPSQKWQSSGSASEVLFFYGSSFGFWSFSHNISL